MWYKFSCVRELIRNCDFCVRLFQSKLCGCGNFNFTNHFHDEVATTCTFLCRLLKAGILKHISTDLSIKVQTCQSTSLNRLQQLSIILVEQTRISAVNQSHRTSDLSCQSSHKISCVRQLSRIIQLSINLAESAMSESNLLSVSTNNFYSLLRNNLALHRDHIIQT